MMNIEFAEKKIEKVAEKHGLSEQGKIWMENCLDPFPDEPRGSQGYPDMVTGPSVVQKLKFAQGIKMPDSFIGVTTWDCVIKTSHFENSCAFTGYNGVGDVNGPGFAYETYDSSNIQSGGLNVYAVATGGSIKHTDIVANLAPSVSYFSNGRTRVVAKGFEVTNTTSQLYKQGAVTVYRCPNQGLPRVGQMIAKFGTSPITTITTPINGMLTGDSPSTYNSLQQFDDSRVWDAASGCYCVATMATPTNRPLNSTEGLTPMQYDATTLPKWYLPRYVYNTPGTGFVINDGNNVVYPTVYNESGAWFTGLSPETTLQVVYHVIVERFVNENALDLVVMTSKSSSFDPYALELYARAATILPTGVQVKNNADGDWIKNVAGMLGDLGVPGMGFVSAGVDLYNKMYPTNGKKGKGKQNNKNNNNNNQKPRQITNGQKKNIEKVVERKVERSMPKLPPLPRTPNGGQGRGRRKRRGGGNRL